MKVAAETERADAPWWRRSAGWGAAAIFAATLAAYHGVLGAEFIWNDLDYVTKPALRSLGGLWRIWFELGATEQYYPLLHSFFWFEHLLWGDVPTGYHLTAIALHATSACLVVAILRRLAVPGAWLAGFVFALHPVCVESVAWIAEQKNTVSLVLYLSAMLAYLRYDEGRERRWHVLASGLFVAAMFGKSVTATLPGAMLVLLWWKNGGLQWRRDVVPLLPWLAAGAAFGIFSGWVERTVIGAQGAAFATSPLERCLLAGRIICFYVGKTLWPTNLNFIYERWQPDVRDPWHYVYPALVLAGTAVLWAGWRRWRGLLAGWLFFLGSLFPTMGFMNIYGFTFSYVADHWQYLPCLGLIAVATAAIATLLGGLPPSRAWLRTAVPVGLLVVLAGATWAQSRLYHRRHLLYTTILERNPACWLAHNLLGADLAMAGRRAEAMAHYRAALKLKPDLLEAHLDLGAALMEEGKLEEAMVHLREALRILPHYPHAHNNLGMALLLANRPGDAVAEFEEAVKWSSKDADARANLARALIRLDRLAEAEARFREALQLNPAHADVHNDLALLLRRLGRLPEAIESLRTARRLRPERANYPFNLGDALAAAGRIPEAIETYEAAVRLKPDFAEAHNNLALVLQAAARPGESQAHLETAVKLRPDYADAHYNLGNLLLNTGQMADAARQYEAALATNSRHVEALCNLAYVLQAAGRPAEAVARYETALGLRSESPEIHFMSAGALLALGRVEEARARLETAVRLRPDYAQAQEALARLRASNPPVSAKP